VLAAARSIIRAKPAVVNWDPRSLTKTNGDAHTLEPVQGPQLVAAQGVRAWGAGLDPPHMQHRRINSTWSQRRSQSSAARSIKGLH
jgi:hypothetical protein